MPWLFRVIDALPIPVLWFAVFAGVVLVVTGSIWWFNIVRLLCYAIPLEWKQWRYRRVQREIRETLSRRYGA